MGISSFAAGFLTSAEKDLKESKVAARKLAETRGAKRATDILKAKAASKVMETELKGRVKVINDLLRQEKFADIGVGLTATAMAGIIEDPVKFEGFRKLATSDNVDPKNLPKLFTPIEGGHEVKNLDQRIELYSKNEAFKNLDPYIKPSSRNFLGMKEDTSDITKQMAAEAGVTEEEFSKSVTTAVPEVTGTFEYSQTKSTDTASELAQTQDLMARATTQLKDRNLDEKDRKEIQNKLSRLNLRKEELIAIQDTSGKSSEDISLSNLRSIIDGGFANLLDSGEVVSVGKNVITFNSNTQRHNYNNSLFKGIKNNEKIISMKKTAANELAKKFTRQLKNMGGSIKNPEKPWYDYETNQLITDNLTPDAASVLSQHTLLFPTSIGASSETIDIPAKVDARDLKLIKVK